MFLYVAVVAALMGGVDASLHDLVKFKHDGLDVKSIAKMAKEQKAGAPAHTRNLRDAYKPHDTVIEFFRDSACTHRALYAVDHGNTCHLDVDEDSGVQKMVKVGCAMGADNKLYHDFADYGSFENNDSNCAGTPVSAPMQVPFFGQSVDPSQCIQFGEMFAKVHCSQKDPFRDQYGLHILQ